MKSTTNETKSLTHETNDIISIEEILDDMEAISQRISDNESLDISTKAKLNNYLQQLSEFELGRFLIKNKGALSGFWTYYIILGYESYPSLHPLEQLIIETAPSVLATRKRFEIFQNLLRKNIQSNSVVCSIPCGIMADLLEVLNLDARIENVVFVGVDYNRLTLDLARSMAIKKGKLETCRFFEENAWDLSVNHPQEFDVITTNGLNIYQPNDDKVVDLYSSLLGALKPGGKLIGSALSSREEWQMSKINKDGLSLQFDIFIQILQATWSNLRSEEKTISQLKAAGFENIEIYWDEPQHMFYTFEASTSKP